jgi:hypothetical protein
MKSIRYRKSSLKTRRNLKGGFAKFFSKKPVSAYSECDINNLSTSFKDMGDGQDPLQKMHANYQKCCPKDSFGRYNSSPYCKQLKMNFDTQLQYQRDISGYYGDETDVSKIKQTMNERTLPPPTPVSKPWYKFWGGKSRRHKKRSRRHRK